MTIPDWLRLRTAPGGARQPTGEVFLPLTAQQALEARREALALAEDEGALAADAAARDCISQYRALGMTFADIEARMLSVISDMMKRYMM